MPFLAKDRIGYADDFKICFVTKAISCPVIWAFSRCIRLYELDGDCIANRFIQPERHDLWHDHYPIAILVFLIRKLAPINQIKFFLMEWIEGH